MSGTTISLPAWQAEDLARDLAAVEDWLLHAGEDVLDDLARFGTGKLGRPGVTWLVSDLGGHGAALHRLLADPAHRSGEPVNTPLTPAGLAGTCPCHDQASCPEQATVAVSAAELASLASLLTDVDQFLRCGNGAAMLAEYCALRGDPHPGYAACTLIDHVSFTAASLRRQAASQAGER